MSDLTRREMWERGYRLREEYAELSFDWRNMSNRLIVDKIEEIGLDGKRIVEIGAGDSQWVPYLAKNHPTSRFAGLDYSRAGCERLYQRMEASAANTDIEVLCEDFFSTETPNHGRFDLVLSFGVVEHFSGLSGALLAKRNYLNEKGFMFTLIPNMAGIIGLFARLVNKAVYDMHKPHDYMSFLEGHYKAGMTVLSGGYIGSINFGVLSSCFTDKKRNLSWYAYVFMNRLSNAIGYTESHLGHFPASKLLSPYIYAISQKR